MVGKRLVYLIGSLLLGCLTLACGLARTGTEFIVFRAAQGIAVSMCLPTAIGILSSSTASGTVRNVGFSCLGLSQAFGFAIGLVLGGFFVDTIGWRIGYYLNGATIIALFLSGIWILPVDDSSSAPTLERLRTEIDWVGAAIATSCLGMLGYVLA